MYSGTNFAGNWNIKQDGMDGYIIRLADGLPYHKFDRNAII